MASDTAKDLHATAEQVLALMRRQGFDAAQVGVSRQHRHELCVAHNEASLLRSALSGKVQLVGLLDGRRADSEGSELDADHLDVLVKGLWASVASAQRSPTPRAQKKMRRLMPPPETAEARTRA